MKLYSTITSERATKGQGGNEFLYADYTLLEKHLSKLRVYMVNNGFITHIIAHFVGCRPIINSYGNDGQQHGISLQETDELIKWAEEQSKIPFVELKGKRQKGETHYGQHIDESGNAYCLQCKKFED